MLEHHPIFVVMAIAVLAPLLAEIPIGLRLPVVVLEIALGVVIGPHVLGLVAGRPNEFLDVMQRAGLGAVLFMAGMEIDFSRIRGQPLSLALRGWLASVALAFAAVGLLHVIPGVDAPLMVTAALTTTMLGALIPLLRDQGLLDTPFGGMVLAAGTVGEIGPIVGVSLLMSTRYTTLHEFIYLLAFLALVAVAVAIGMGVRPRWALALLSRTMHASAQLPVRLVLFAVVGLSVLSVELGFESILGSFAAGMIVGLATRGEDGESIRVKLDAVCFGFLSPFFFVATGIAFDLGALTHSVATMLLTPAFLLLFLLARGAPVLLYGDKLPKSERLAFAFSTSVASLGLVVAITQIGLRARAMNPDIAHALIGAAVFSMLLYPTLGGVLLSKAVGRAAGVSTSDAKVGESRGS